MAPDSRGMATIDLKEDTPMMFDELPSTPPPRFADRVPAPVFQGYVPSQITRYRAISLIALLVSAGAFMISLFLPQYGPSVAFTAIATGFVAVLSIRALRPINALELALLERSADYVPAISAPMAQLVTKQNRILAYQYQAFSRYASGYMSRHSQWFQQHELITRCRARVARADDERLWHSREVA